MGRAGTVLQAMQGLCILLLISSSWCLVQARGGILTRQEIRDAAENPILRRQMIKKLEENPTMRRQMKKILAKDPILRRQMMRVAGKQMMRLAGSGQRTARNGQRIDVEAGVATRDNNLNLCFSGSSMVDTKQRGQIQLRDLKLNDSVLTFTPGVGSHFTEFLGWLTRSSSSPTLMLKISTSTNSSLTLTANHIVFRLSGEGELESVYANQLVEGDRLVRLESRDRAAVEFDEVVEIQVVWEEGGYWAPLTREGSLLVNGFLASSFASFPHHLCQQVSAFLRIFLVLDDEASQHEDGERHVVTASIKLLEMFGLRGWIPLAASEMKKEVKRNLGAKVADEKILRVSDHIEL